MAVNRKRRADDQLSPYSTEGETKIQNEKETKPKEQKIKKRARATIGGSVGISDPDSIKGLLSNVNIIKPKVSNDKVSGLNRSFLEAVKKVIQTQSNKDLTFLIKQYEKYLKSIEK